MYERCDNLGGVWPVLFTVASAVAHEAGAPLEGPLGADDECEATDGGAAGECSVELRQLRAHSVKAETKDEAVTEEGSELFGPNARGRNMWRARTWTDIAALVQFNESVQGPCVAQTGATCSMFACKASRGATDCVKMQCQCATGFCAQAGTCYPTSPTQCLEDTGGSCTVSACRSSRGGTYCDSGKCLCNPGNCAWKGTCFPATDTGGTCKAFGCDSSRGPSTCNQGRCLCQDGYVAVKGTCVTPT